MNPPAPSPALAYGVSLIVLVAAVLLRWLLDPVMGGTLPLTTLFGAIGVAVWIGGYRPALLVVVLGYAACYSLFIQSRGEPGLSEPRNLVGLFLYLATASIIIVFGEALRRAQQHSRRGEEAARQQTELLRTTLASIGDGVITTDADGRITSMNGVAETLTGWTNSEAAGMPLVQVFRIVNESTRREVENPALRALQEGRIVGLANHTILIGRDGTERPIDDSAAPIRSALGEVVGSVLVFRDISERQRAEAEQQLVQERIATTLESVTDGFMRYDREWRISYVNAEAERINRLPRGEMLGRVVWEVFPTLVGTNFESEFRRAVADRVTIEFDNYYEPFGRWYSLKGYPTDDGGLTTYIRDITTQKVSLEALERSEARLRRVFESNVVGMIQWDLDRSLILDANETFLRMTGYTREDVAAGRLNFRDMTPAEWTARNEEGIKTIRADGRAAPYEKEYFRKDGSRVPLIIAGTRFDDSPSEGMSLLIDISDRKRAEEEIARLAAESERQRRLYETVLTNTPDFVYVFSLDHKVVYANDALIKMWGRGHDGAIGRTFLEIGYEPWHAEMHDREIDQVRATRAPIRGEVPFHGTHGVRQYDYIFVPVFGADGEVEAVAGTTRDVTERKASEAERERLLREVEGERGRLADVFRQAPAFLCVVRGPDHVYEMANDQYFTLVGRRDIIGRTVRDALPEVEEQGFVALLDGVYRTGEPFIGTGVRLLLDQIGERYVDFVYQALRDPAGSVSGVVAVGVDVTARHQAEEALRLSEERFRTLFNSMDEGFCVIEVEFDPAGRAADYRIEVMNAAFEKHTGMSGLAGKSIRQAIPELEEFWFETYGRVAKTGDSTRFVHEAGPMGGRWFDVAAFRIGGDGSHRVAVLFNDITARRQAEETIRASEGRHTFLVQLADTLRPLSDPVFVQAEASRLLGERLGANRVVYFEIRGDEYFVERDFTSGVRPLAGRYPVAAFGSTLLASLLNGRTVIEADATTEPERPPDERAAFAAIQVRGHVDVPLVKGGRFVAGLTVQVSDRRDWTPPEVSLIEETAERTWAALEKVRAEAALRASEESRRLALDAAELGAFNIDPALNALVSDERFRIIFAGTTEALDYEEAFAAVHPDDRERIRAAVAAATRSDDPAPYAEEYRVVHRDGSVHWVFAKGRASVDLKRPGRIVSFDGTVADITARKRAEASLKESEERFRLMADAAPVMIWMSGTDRLVSWYNRPWLEFTGRTMEEEVSSGATEVVHPDDLGRTLPIYTAAFEGRAPFSMEYRLRRHDGEFRWMISNGVPRYRADGEFAGYIGSCFDVTDYKNAQAALRDADRRKDEFLATLAHELRNPLAPIRNGLQVMRMAGMDEAVEQTRAMMERQLGQMIRLVDDLLDVSRVTSGKLRLRRERVELRAMIDAAVETTRPVIEQAGHDLRVAIPDEPIFVDGDPIRLAQVVSNLLNNSAKYTHGGGHIRLSVRREEERAVVRVADDGIGIPPQMVGKVFEMFTQVDRALEATTGGLGIGLSLVKGLVEMHGGTVEARSEGEGRGSEFIISLPLAVGVAPRVEPAAAVAKPARSVPRIRILVADDNVDSARSLGRLLELIGNDVRTANDGLEAVDVAEEFQPEVLLLDIAMPKLNGFEVCRRIRQTPWGRNATLVALTGWGQEEDKRRSHEAGFDLHLVKPVDIGAIKELLASLSAKQVESSG